MIVNFSWVQCTVSTLQYFEVSLGFMNDLHQFCTFLFMHRVTQQQPGPPLACMARCNSAAAAAAAAVFETVHWSTSF